MDKSIDNTDATAEPSPTTKAMPLVLGVLGLLLSPFVHGALGLALGGAAWDRATKLGIRPVWGVLACLAGVAGLGAALYRDLS